MTETTGLTSEQLATLARLQERGGGEDGELGPMPLPLSVATNFIVMGRDVLVPMVQEEASVVAAASNAAKACRSTGGFKGSCSTLPTCAKIVLQCVSDESATETATQLMDQLPALLETHGLHNATAHATCPVQSGSVVITVSSPASSADLQAAISPRTLFFSSLRTAAPHATIIMARCEPFQLRHRVTATATWPLASLSKRPKESAEVQRELGVVAVQRILDGWALAACDPYRAATHNKGIMNGIEAIARAIGADTASVEALAHCGSIVDGGGPGYTSLTRYSTSDTGDLTGEIHLFLPTLPDLQTPADSSSLAASMLRNPDSASLAVTLAAVGLAQNMAALWALATDGIQAGHMRMHAKNVAVMGGAEGEAMVQAVVEQMVKENAVSVSNATTIVQKLRSATPEGS